MQLIGYQSNALFMESFVREISIIDEKHTSGFLLNLENLENLENWPFLQNLIKNLGIVREFSIIFIQVGERSGETKYLVI